MVTIEELQSNVEGLAQELTDVVKAVYIKAYFEGYRDGLVDNGKELTR